jgi:hypothetical protein
MSGEREEGLFQFPLPSGERVRVRGGSRLDGDLEAHSS